MQQLILNSPDSMMFFLGMVPSFSSSLSSLSFPSSSSHVGAYFDLIDGEYPKYEYEHEQKES